jgi:hypothetical protein
MHKNQFTDAMTWSWHRSLPSSVHRGGELSLSVAGLWHVAHGWWTDGIIEQQQRWSPDGVVPTGHPRRARPGRWRFAKT